jgi:hypothetical protein
MLVTVAMLTAGVGFMGPVELVVRRAFVRVAIVFPRGDRNVSHDTILR